MLYTVSQVLYQILFVPAVASTDLGGNSCFFRIGLPVGFLSIHPLPSTIRLIIMEATVSPEEFRQVAMGSTR